MVLNQDNPGWEHKLYKNDALSSEPSFSKRLFITVDSVMVLIAHIPTLVSLLLWYKCPKCGVDSDIYELMQYLYN